MKKTNLIAILAILVNINVGWIACANEPKIVEDYEKEFFTGNWYDSAILPPNAQLVENRWGRGYTIVNFTLLISLIDDYKCVQLPALGGPFTVTEFTCIKKEELYKITYYFERGEFYETYYIHSNFDDSIFWLEPIDTAPEPLISNGKDRMFYKISGPGFEGNPPIIGVVNDNKLRVRTKPLTGDVLGFFDKGVRLALLGRTEKEETIDNVTGFWYKIRYLNQDAWIFGGYVDVSSSDFNRLTVED